jgi:hypothetical protein
MMQRYEIWMANVKFEDSPEVKQRPVMIWNLTKADLVMKIGELDYRDRLRFELRIAG